MTITVTDEMVNRFLAWKLPSDFNPDCGISFKRESDYDHPEFGRMKYEPTGTNLLNAAQARAMLAYVLCVAADIEAEPRAEAEADFLANSKACNLSGDGTCEACQ